jgi:hypothetical protein
MHMPERWGHVQFSSVAAGSETEFFVDDPNERVKWALRRLYYRQRRFRDTNGRYAATLDALHASDTRVDGVDFRPRSPGDGVALRDHGEGIRRSRRAHHTGRPRLADALTIRPYPARTGGLSHVLIR